MKETALGHDLRAQYCNDILVFSIYRMTWKNAGTIRKRKKDETGEVKLKRKIGYRSISLSQKDIHCGQEYESVVLGFARIKYHFFYTEKVPLQVSSFVLEENDRNQSPG